MKANIAIIKNGMLKSLHPEYREMFQQYNLSDGAMVEVLMQDDERNAALVISTQTGSTKAMWVNRNHLEFGWTP